MLGLATLPAASLPQSPGAYVALLAAGFGIAILGQLFRVRWLLLAGLALIVIAALLLPLAAGIPSGEKAPPAEESLGGEGG